MLVTDIKKKKYAGKERGFYMQKYLAQNLSSLPAYLDASWDCVGIISGHGKVRIGKTILPNSDIKVIENNKIINKKLLEFKDGDFINTLSWDFKNNKQVESVSEVIVEKEEKDFFEVELENGKKVVCSKDHKLFVKRKDRIVELKLRDIKEGDEIVCLN